MGQPSMLLPKGMPLKNVRCARLIRYEAGRDWYRVVGEGGIQAEVLHPEDAFLCRLEPPGHAPLGGDVVQLSIGRVRSRIADSLFSPQQDVGFRFSGKDLCVEWSEAAGCYAVSAESALTVRVKRDFYRRGHHLKWYRPLDRSVFRRAPAGWCSWYTYGLGIDEAKTLRNLKWLHENLAPFGLQYVQVDDGWQGLGSGRGRNRDWFVTCAEKFPHGMKWLAGQIRKAGLSPGIWLIPFTQSNPKLFESAPDMFVRDSSGGSIGELKAPVDHEWVPPPERHIEWMGRYVLDPTSKKTQAYLERLFHMLCPEWGYEYVKIDAQGRMADAFRRHRQRLAQPALSGDEAYRLGLSIIKGLMGKDRFLLNCGEGWDSAGYCEGIRIGSDVGPSIVGLETAVACTLRYLYLNGIVWWTDPDCVCMRPPLTLEQARAWVSLLGITGQLLMTSDDMPALDAARVEMLKRILPAADIRPMELYPLKGWPFVFDLKINKAGVGEWDVVAVFNWNRSWTWSGPVSAEALGIPPNERGFLFYDVWNEEVLGQGVTAVEVSVPPTSCRVLCIRALPGYPQVIGASRHITQGADDLEEVTWNAKTRTLSGRSRVVANDPYRIRFTVPRGWELAEPSGEVRQGVGLLTVSSKTSKRVRWRVRFVKA